MLLYACAEGEESMKLKIEKVPYSSVVGQSVTLISKEKGVAAILMISIPQPSLDYALYAKAIADALERLDEIEIEVSP
jgi:hypothetical protein